MSKNNQLWTEKYRPKHVKDILLPETLKLEFNKMISEKYINNIMMSGPPGIGKTTTELCLARDLYSENKTQAVLELNASDERGMKTIENKIKSFCSNDLIDSKDKFKYKLVLLDEIDNMTKQAQEKLCQIMDMYYHNTRFIMTCNHSSKIEDSLQSKCLLIRFMNVGKDLCVKRLIEICKKENIEYSDDCICILVNITNGDMRIAINQLEKIYTNYGCITSKKNIYKMSDKPEPELINNVFKLLMELKLEEAIFEVNKLKDLGYSYSDIVENMKLTLSLNDIKQQINDMAPTGENKNKLNVSDLCVCVIEEEEDIVKFVELIADNINNAAINNNSMIQINKLLSNMYLYFYEKNKLKKKTKNNSK